MSRPPTWFRLVVVLLCAFLGACYRSVEVRAAELPLVTDPGRTALRGRLIVDHYDTVIVVSKDEVRRGDLEIEGPVQSAIVGDYLTLKSDRVKWALRENEVDHIELVEAAPDRPWIILGASVAAAVVGGVVGYHAAGKCDYHSDLGCLANGISAAGGASIGLGLGLGLSIPLTSQLGHQP